MGLAIQFYCSYAQYSFGMIRFAKLKCVVSLRFAHFTQRGVDVELVTHHLFVSFYVGEMSRFSGAFASAETTR